MRRSSLKLHNATNTGTYGIDTVISNSHELDSKHVFVFQRFAIRVLTCMDIYANLYVKEAHVCVCFSLSACSCSTHTLLKSRRSS